MLRSSFRHLDGRARRKEELTQEGDLPSFMGYKAPSIE
jgi:hypothetical protein